MAQQIGNIENGSFEASSSSEFEAFKRMADERQAALAALQAVFN